MSSKSKAITMARRAKAARQRFETGTARVRTTKRAKRTRVQPKA